VIPRPKRKIEQVPTRKRPPEPPVDPLDGLRRFLASNVVTLLPKGNIRP
jgi:hypothetical protein